MTSTFLPRSLLPSVASLAERMRAVAAACLCVIAAGCGGNSDTTPPPEGTPPAAVAPVITQQPASQSVTAGQPATFSVAATGTAPLGYQWQRNGTPISGATSASYTLAAAGPSDSGVTFAAVVSNVAGSVTSSAATLSVATAPPVLTIGTQPADVTVVAGTAASFLVAGTCSAGMVQIQWQRLNGAAFADIGNATLATYTLTPAIGDNGAQFRANLSCSGQSASPTRVATLGVTAPPSGGILSRIAFTGLRNQADIEMLGGIVREPSGSYAFASAGTIRRLSADLSTITLIAGSSTASGPAVDGVGAAARFITPRGITVDPDGNLYVVDMSANTVRRIATDGTVTTIAGMSGSFGTADGTGSAARFNFPDAIAMGPDGDLYVADRANMSIRRVTPAGVVTTYAGSTGTGGYADGMPMAARFSLPAGVAVAADGTVYVSDLGNSRIRRILRSGNGAGAVGTLAGGAPPTAPGGGAGAAAYIAAPFDMALVGSTIYVRDGSRLLRAVDVTTGAVTTVTGNSSPLPVGQTVSFSDGPRGTSKIDGIVGGVAATGDGRLLLTDGASGSVRLVATDGSITTLAVAAAYEDDYFDHAGVGVLAQRPIVFDNMRPPIAAAPDGSILMASPQAIRRIAQDGSVTPVAGLVGSGGVSGFRPGANSAASFIGITAMAVKADGTIAVFDGTGIRTVAPLTNAVTSLAGPTAFDLIGGVDGAGPAARFQALTSIAYAANGDILAADTYNAAIRRITPDGVVSTFAGAMGQFGGVDGPAGVARFQQPYALAIAPDGTVWVEDKVGGVPQLRKVAADGSVTTLAVSGVNLALGIGQLAFDPAGNLFILAGGLYQLNTTTGAATLRIPVSPNATTFGSSPAIAAGADRLIATGVKQLVFVDHSILPDIGQLLRSTLP